MSDTRPSRRPDARPRIVRGGMQLARPLTSVAASQGAVTTSVTTGLSAPLAPDSRGRPVRQLPNRKRGVERQGAYLGHGPRPSPALAIARASHRPGCADCRDSAPSVRWAGVDAARTRCAPGKSHVSRLVRGKPCFRPCTASIAQSIHAALLQCEPDLVREFASMAVVKDNVAIAPDAGLLCVGGYVP
jgi:hypothetical protein